MEAAWLESGRPYPALHKLLLKALLRCLMSVLAPDGTQRVRDILATPLPKIFTTLYQHALVIGGGVISICNHLLSMLIQNEPMSIPQILETPMMSAWATSLVSAFPVHQMVWVAVRAFGG